MQGNTPWTTFYIWSWKMDQVWNQRPAAARSEVHHRGGRLTGLRLFLSADCQRVSVIEAASTSSSQSASTSVRLFIQIPEIAWGPMNIFITGRKRAEYISFNQKFLFVQQVKLQLEIWNRLSPSRSLWLWLWLPPYLRFPALKKLQSFEHSSHVFLSQKESHANLSFTLNHKNM